MTTDTQSDRPANMHVDRKTLEEGMRAWNDLLSIWRLCRNAACVRSSCCRGNPDACRQKHVALLPEGVRDWFEGVREARIRGLNFDEAMEHLDSLPEGDAFREWCAAVDASMGRESHKWDRPWWKQ